MENIFYKLGEFKKSHEFNGKGPLCVALVVTRIAWDHGLPLDPNSLLTPRKGQVKGLGKEPVQKILHDHGIKRVLAEEGGRTSRGSIRNMENYVSFLNALAQEGQIDFKTIEEWWVEQVKGFFASKPFVLKVDPGKSLRAAVNDLLAQASKRQEESQGTMFVGGVMQHLVGAKLALIIENDEIEHHGFSVADESSGRSADFLIQDAAIHVTAAPGEALIRKCKRNIDNGLKPIIVTISQKVALAEELAKQSEINERIDILEIEQFLATNVYEKSQFRIAERRITIESILELYNAIIDSCETDAGLKIMLD